VKQPLLYEQKEHVVVLTLNDPATRNALTGEEVFSAFEQSVERINGDLSVRAVVLTGEGSAFCSGGNLRDMRDRKGMFAGPPQDIEKQYERGIQRIPRALFRLETPTIAAVNGPAFGAGCDLACMCDMRIASERAVFAVNFVKVGIVPGDGGAWLLPRAVGFSRAAEMAFTGEPVDAHTALQIGLVSKVVPHDRLMPEAMSLASRIAANPPHALRWTKRLLREAQLSSLERVLEMSAAYQAFAHHTSDHAEAVAALFEKRAPGFRGC
jgi:2-(1,2-epoxy-1,2-dihydrophenyl)acetyl-CoA isomerase